MDENSQVRVFVFPDSIRFFASDQTTHKQVLTIYNPYSFPVRFQVLCNTNDKNKYIVVEPQGTINSNFCADIIIRHNAINQHNINVVDKFRIRIFQLSNDRILGHKDVKAELLAGEPERQSSREREVFQQLPASNTGSTPHQYNFPRREMGRAGAPSPYVIGLAIVSVATLLLPTDGESSTIWIFEYFRPSVNVKLAASYVLGLLTMVIIRHA